jgi:hypothetical protein
MREAPRCGAKRKYDGRPCQAPAMENGRCRLHGGKSTGRPIIHGWYSKAAVDERRRVRAMLKDMKATMADLKALGPDW